VICTPASRAEHAVDIALGIDDERGCAVVHQVAAIPQRLGLDRDDLCHREFLDVEPEEPKLIAPGVQRVCVSIDMLITPYRARVRRRSGSDT
jgi:hypothetical protein